MKTKLFLAAAVPFIALFIASRFIALDLTIRMLGMLIAAEILSAIIFFAGKLCRLSEEDLIRREVAELSALALAAIMFFLSFGAMVFFRIADSAFFSAHKNILIFLTGVASIALAGYSGLIALMPIRGKWANIRHTTFLLLGSALCFIIFLSAYTNLWPIGIAVWAIEVVIFSYSFRRISAEEKDEIAAEKTAGGHERQVNVEFHCTGRE
ncbi:MAG: hypothetical protein PHE24_05910 [Patescibacteria group bacterium]|nr:hypothetical protein [Patescibacteria group bacterium]